MLEFKLLCIYRVAIIPVMSFMYNSNNLHLTPDFQTCEKNMWNLFIFLFLSASGAKKKKKKTIKHITGK